MNGNQWYAYLHTNGSFLIKRFFPGDESAKESTFVKEVFGPVEADGYDMAAIKLGFGKKKPRIKLKFKNGE